MSVEQPAFLIQPPGPAHELFPPPDAAQKPEALETPTPEQVRAVEQVFAQQEQESATVANILGLYTSGVLLHNLVTDALTPTEEVKEKPRLKSDEDKKEEND